MKFQRTKWQAASALGATALALVVGASSSGCRGWTSDAPPVHLNPNMDTQQKLKPYRASSFFKDGRTMRPQVEGTIARGQLRNDDHRFEGKLASGTFAGTFPTGFAADAKDVQRGQRRYEIYCTPCHSSAGDGNGPVARRLLIKPPTFHQDRIQTMPVGEIFNVITHGKNYPNMPAYAAQIPVEDRWRISLYVRALQRTRMPSLPIVTVQKAAAPAGEGTDGEATEGEGADSAAAEGDAADGDKKELKEVRPLPQGLNAEQLKEHAREMAAEREKNQGKKATE